MEQNNTPLSEKLSEEKVPGSVANITQPYVTAKDLFDTRQYGEDYLKMADPAGLLSVQRYKSDMFKFGPDVFANLQAPDPGLADVGFNPGGKSETSDLSLADQLVLAAQTPTKYSQDIKNPVYGNIVNMNFDRQYNHPSYSELGFKPYADNESYYNANSSKLDDLTRAFGQFGKQFGTGLTASWNAIGDMFDGDGYIDQPDLDGAFNMEEAMRIGSTSRGGAFGTVTNVGLSFGYTAGIITSIAIEELILAAGSAALTSSGVGAPGGVGAFIAGTGRNLFRAGRQIANLFDVKRYASAGMAMARTLNDVKNARQLFNGTAQAVGKIFAPEVTRAISEWQTTGNAAQNLFNISKSNNLFGAAYRDFRQVNLALAEGKLEAGMVENRVRANQLRYLNRIQPGEQVTAQQLADIDQKSRQAAFRSQMQNTAIIYFSNKLFLRGALRGWRNGPSKRVVEKLFRTNPLVDPLSGKALKGIYKQQSKYMLGALGQRLKVAGLRGAPRVFAGAMLRYGAGGIAEGLQEVSQEAIAATNEGYYGALLKEPGAAIKPVYGSFAMEGIKDQFSEQGFETFMSGFLMSVLAGPYQQVLFQGMPYLYSRRNKNSRQDYASQKAAEAQVINTAIQQANESSMGQSGAESTPIEQILSPTQMAASLSKNTIDAQDEALTAGDRYNWYNNMYFGNFANLFHKFQNGTIALQEEELQAYNELTDEELVQAFPDEGNAQKIREKLVKQQDLINKYGEMFDKRKDVFKKRYEPKLFTPGTRQYNDEVALKNAYKHMEMFTMFTQGAFEDALQRKTSIASKLSSTPLFGKMSANDVTPLLDSQSLEIEIDRLTQEIEVLQSNLKNVTGLSDLDKKRDKKTLKDKKTRKKRLEAVSKVYNSNLTEKGFYDRRKKKSLAGPIKLYLKALASQQGTFVDNDAVNEAIQEIIDYATLSQDAYAFNQTIDYLLDPNKMEGLIARSRDYFRMLGINKNAILRAQIEDYILTNNQNSFLNELAKENIFLDPQEARAFLETGDVNKLKTYIYAGRVLNPTVVEDMKIISTIVNPIIQVYVNSTSVNKVLEEAGIEEAAAEESSVEVKETLNAAGIDVNIKDTSQSKNLQRVFEKQFREYQANTFGDTLLTFNEWKQSPEALNIKEGFDSLKKIWGAGIQKFDVNGNTVQFVPSQQELDQEIGFQDFINNDADTNPTVRDVLQELDVNISIYKTTKAAPSKGIIKEGLVVDLQKRVLDETNPDETTTYALLDKDGNLINDRMKQMIGTNASGTFSALQAAQDAFDLLEKEGSDGTTFLFGGMVLSRGVRVVDNQGNAFVVNTNARGNQTNPTVIYLVPQEQFSANFYANSQAAKQFGPVREEDFIGRYRLQEEIKLEPLGPNFAKLPPDEVIRAWPHQNNRYQPDQESRESADQRLNFFIGSLSPEQVDNLVIFIKPGTPNPNPGSYQIPGQDTELNKLPNKYILDRGNEYSIGIQIVEPGILQNLNAAAIEAGITPLADNADGVFAYLPSNQFEFRQDDVVVSPETMSEEFMLSTIYLGDQDASNALKRVRQNFATAKTLQAAVKKAIGDAQEGTIEVGKLPDSLKLQTFFGFPNYTKPNTFTEVASLPLDKGGSTFVVLDVDQISLIPTIITNLEDQTELEETIEKQLIKQGVLDADGKFQQELTNRYNVVLRQPSGLLTVATARPKAQPAADLEIILNEYINEAQKVLETNVTKEGNKTVAKDKNITKEFNKKQSKKLFIKSDVKGRQFFLDVTPFGSISLSVKDKVKGPGSQIVGVAKYAQVGKTEYLYNQDFSRDDKGEVEVTAKAIFQKLIDKINAPYIARDESPILNIENFGVSIAQDAPVSDYFSGLESAIDPQNFRKGQKLIITANSKDVQAEADKPIIIESSFVEPVATTEIEEVLVEKDLLSPTNLPDLVSAWLLTEEGSLANQSAAESAGKFALEYNKRFSPTEGLTEEEVTGKDMFNVVGQGLAVMETILDEINRQTLAIEAVKSEARLEEAVTLDTVLKQIKELKEDIKSKTALLSSKEKRQALKENKKLQALYKKRDELRSANKIVDSKLTTKDIEDINVFTSWMETNLPEFITIGDINDLGNNLKGNQERVGNFMINITDIAGGLDVKGTVYTGANNIFRYHEAFHGVYRMLLTKTQQDQYLSIARKEKLAELRKEGKSLASELQKLRNSWPSYKSMSKERLEREYFEEYLADRFEQFKQDRRGTKTNSKIKAFFNRLIEIIKALVNRFRRNELNTLFENIDAGKFSSASMAVNEFTTGAFGVTVEANKLIPYEAQYENKEDGILYIPSIVAEPIIDTMAGILIEKKFAFVPTPEKPKFILEEELDTIIDDFATLYDVDSKENSQYNEDSPERMMLEKLTLAFEDFSDNIKDSVMNLLDIIDLQSAQQNSNNEIIMADGQEFSSVEDLGGLRTVSQFGKETYLTGGFDNLSARLRQYITTVTMPATDYFGNTELANGVPFVRPVRANIVYNGLLKALQGLTDPLQIIQKMQLFSDTNPDTAAVVSSIFEDAGIIPLNEKDEVINELPLQLKNPDFFNKVIKAFTNFRVEWYFQQRDDNGNTLIHSASQRDDASTQVDNWSEAYTNKLQEWQDDPRKKTRALKTLAKVKNSLRQANDKIQNKTVNRLAKDLSRELYEAIGFRVSVGYMRFSLLKSRVNKFKNQETELGFYPNLEPITYDQLQALQSLIAAGQDPFDKGIEGAASRIKTIALNNAVLDETVGASVFKNSNGDLVNSHQQPTYHLVKTKKLNSVEERNRLKEDPFLNNNYLLNSQAFNALADNQQIKISRVSGTKILNQLSTELDPNRSNALKTTDFGKFTPGEFIVSNTNLYLANLNYLTDNVSNFVLVKDPVSGIETEVALSPVLNRVIESSNTGDLTTLPIIKAIEKVKGKDVITSEALDVFYDFVKNEYNRIVRERNADELTQSIQGYNLEDSEVTPRGFTFANNDYLLDPATKVALEGQAKGEPISFEQALKNSGLSVTQFKNQLRRKLGERYLLFKGLIDTENVREKIDKRIRFGLNDNAVENGIDALYNLRQNDEEYNLKQIFLSNAINVKSLNELLLGDQAKTLKNFNDKTKRAKGQNGAGPPAYTPFIDPQKGINHATDKINLITLSEPQSISSISGQPIDNADAQMYITTKAFRHFFYGFGMLSDAQAQALDKIEKGEKLEWDEIQNLIDLKGMMNSKKLVYFDGQTFLKMSAFVLTPELTSKKNADGQFVARPNAVALHNLRVRLEALEEGTETVSVAAPLSAVKMLKQDIIPYQELNMPEPGFSQESTTLSAEFMRLQQINPSNKKKITELSQMKTLITNEQAPRLSKKIERYNDLISQRQRMKFFNKKNLSFDENNKFNPVLFSKYAVNSLKASQVNSNIIEFFSLDKFNQPKYNLNNPYTIAKFEQLFLSYFSQDVFQEKVPGTSFALVSSFGYQIYRRVFSVDEKGIPQRQEVLRASVVDRTNIPVDTRTAEDLVGIDIPKEGIVILDRVRYNIPEYDDNGKATGNKYSEGIYPPQFESVYNLQYGTAESIPKVVSDMFTVRIPSQDKHSAMAVRMVDFLPSFYGSSAMFPDELVEIAGSDFDIDVGYSQRKDFYVRDKEFIEYGNNYEDYVNYINREVKEVGTIYNSALELYNLQGSLIEDSLTDIEDTSAETAGFSRESIGALQALSLPVTKKQFNEFIAENGYAPYDAPINNEIVDIRRELVGNKEMTSGDMIAYSPANLDIMKTAWETLSSEAFVPSLKSREIVDLQNIDDMAGQTIAFTNNKGASIGSVVSPNLYLSLIVQRGILLDRQSFNLDGEFYSTFKGSKTKDGARKQDIISSVVTMMTDNAKEYFVAKLGLNSHATRMLTNMIAIGVPLNTSLLLLNNQFIQQQYREIANSDIATKGIKGRVDDQLAELEKVKAVEPTQEILIAGVDNMSDLTAGQQKGILSVFKNIMRISDFTAKLNSVLSLNNGLGKDMLRLDKRKSDINDMLEEQRDELPLLQFASIFNNTYLGELRKMFDNLYDDLLPNVFLTRTNKFKVSEINLLGELNQQALEFNPNLRSKVRKDILAYFTIQNYINQKLDSDAFSVEGMNNNLIYPSADNKLNTIISAVERLKKTDPGNFFLENFITTLPAQAKQNFAGINLVRSNSWRRLNRIQMSDLQTSFNKLYNNLDTRKDARKIIAYIFVKDAMQLAPGSLIQALSPYVLEDYLQSIPQNLDNIPMVGGEFIRNYLSAASSQDLLAIKKQDDKVEDMPMIYKTLSATDPATGERKSITYRRLQEEDIEGIETAQQLVKSNEYYTDAKVVDIKGSPLQNAIGFIFGDLPFTKDLRKSNSQIKNDEGLDMSKNFADAAIEQSIQEEALSNPSFNTVYNGEDIIIESADGTQVNIDDVNKLASLEADFQAATDELGIEEVGIIDDNIVPPITESVQLTLDLLSETDPAVGYPEITEFWDNNIESGEFSMQVEAFKEQNNVNTLEDLIDLYENNPNSFWSKPEDLIEQIKRCNL